MTKLAAGSPKSRADGGVVVPGVSDVARQPLRICSYRSCRAEFRAPGWGRYCSQRCLERDFDEKDGVA